MRHAIARFSDDCEDSGGRTKCAVTICFRRHKGITSFLQTKGMVTCRSLNSAKSRAKGSLEVAMSALRDMEACSSVSCIWSVGGTY